MRHLLAFLLSSFALLVLSGSAAPPELIADPVVQADEPDEMACCKTCHKGKACGDSCISREKQCHKGQGCACDG